MSDLLIGKKLGDYTIQRLLGKGGMARVYVGYDERLQRYAAVKVIDSELANADEGEYAERFRREARAIARLNHPNIVGVYQFGDYDKLYYMAMAFIEGRDLRQILRDHADQGKRMAYRDVLNIVQGIGEALDYAHHRGVIHRDIKPSNIMLDQDNRPILTDFGLALASWEGTLGDTFGTAHYIAPEQAISSARAVPQSDLYSLGICTYEMLAGRVPFDDPSAMSVALKHLNDVPPPLRSIASDVPLAVEAVIMKTLEKAPENRFVSGEEMAQALAVAFAGLITDSRPSRRNSPLMDLMKHDSWPVRPADTGPKRPANTPPAAPPAAPPVQPAGRAAKAAPAGKKPPPFTVQADAPPLQPPGVSKPPASASAPAPRPVPPPIVDTRPSVPDPSRTRELDMKSLEKNRRSPVLRVVPVAVVALIALALFMSRGSDSGSPTPTTDQAVVSASETAIQAAALVALQATETAHAQIVLQTEQATTAPSESAPTVAIESTESTEPAGPAETPVTPSVTPAITPSATPSVSATARPSATITPSLTPSTTPTPTPTFTPTATRTRVAGAPPDLLLVYNQEQFNLVNTGDRTLDVSVLTFRRDGIQFEARRWRVAGVRYTPEALPPTWCFQIVRDVIGKIPTMPECAFLSGYLQSSRFFWFWVSDEPAAFFEVYSNSTRLAVCQISRQRCEVNLP